MSDERTEFELPTPDEFLAGARECNIIPEVVEELRAEESSKPDENAIREQEDWSAVANKFVGAEDAAPQAQ